ncbi:sugar kinase [Ureibacillus sinduriensis]|uniref:2-keto-3-deoxygluconate kinase n=1 Tax=Ureibacillus sinduriensis BLB-1 = JCM 15800 TaxID=1384057 RepID=A0A0A3HRE1_9BACL|nr:sugar kinase [Ureibacillus sinduriensis]KGR75176.1 2-keto-3-deoxygluconate kinase [Ureibacillus sinduriensis BLB-1 = JCM 15800]
MDIITIGDGMITFDPSVKGPLRYVDGFKRKIGGAELNVMIGCARLGLKAGWISRLGKDEFGRHILNTVRGEGIDVSEVKLIENYPTSLNFKEVHASGDSKTFYYRHKSPTETFKAEELPVDYIKKAKILHVTGVFPAILEQNRQIILEALKIAKQNGVKVSFDPNIRLKLWSKEQARETLLSYLPYVDFLLTGREELEILFETSNEDEMIQALQNFDIKHVVVKDGALGASYLENNRLIQVEGFKVGKVVDTVGAGDGFDAAFLYGIIQDWSIEKSITLANAVGAMVVQVEGDNEGLPYLEDVEVFLGTREKIER